MAVAMQPSLSSAAVVDRIIRPRVVGRCSLGPRRASRNLTEVPTSGHLGGAALVVSTVLFRPLGRRGRTACNESQMVYSAPQLDNLVDHLELFTMPATVVDRGSSSWPTTVVDCGSSSTRAITFREDHRSILSSDESSWHAYPLALALQNEKQMQELVDFLAERVPGQGPVLVGATAGVRQALDDGTVAPEQLDIFATSLQAKLGHRASFQVLSGVQEALAEWEAVLQRNWLPRGCSGMLSSGGMSCQLVATSPDPILCSFPNQVLASGGLVDQAAKGTLGPESLLEGLCHVRKAALEQLRHLPRGLEGTFALIEWVGYYIGGENSDHDLALGLGYDRVLAREEVLEALDTQLASMQKECLPAWAHTCSALEEKGSVPVTLPRMLVEALVYGTLMKVLLENMFAKGASFCCLRSVSWATGHYLLNRDELCL